MHNDFACILVEGISDHDRNRGRASTHIARQIDMGDDQIYRNSHFLFGSYPYAIMLSRGNS